MLELFKTLENALSDFEVVHFESSQKALAYLKKPNEINLVIAEFHLNEMDGIDLVKEIKRRNQDIAVFLISMHCSKDIIIQALRAKVEDFIEKPINVYEFKEKVEDFLKEKLHVQKSKRDKESHANRVRRFIERNCNNATLDYISSAVCLSPKYISRIFNSYSDINFRDFKLQVKMEKAKGLLEKSALNINEISIELGYQNPESFMRMFKRIEHVTPKQYRKKKQKRRSRAYSI